MGEHVQVHCPAGEITGTAVDGVSYFRSISHLSFDPFGPSRLADPARIDARLPRPAEVALTVTVPTGTRENADLPVLVYIHGGAYETGSHEEPRTQAGAFARAGVITVTLGYRLGMAGFVRFHDDDPNHYRGIDDCLLGLEWIQRNIESFGGDPTNVTLSGQSAGAGIVLWLARRDHFRGGFRRALAMSPAVPRQPFHQRKGSLRAALTRPVTRTALAELPPKALERGLKRFKTRHATDMALGPAPFDGAQLSDLPILVTETREEFYNHPLGLRLDRAGMSAAGARLLGRTMGLKAVGDYLTQAREFDPAGVARQLIGDSLIRRWASHLAESAPGPVWLAELAGTPRQPALHAGDISLVFHTLSAESYFHDPGDRTVQQLADLLHGEVLSFIRGHLPQWPQYHPEAGKRVARQITQHDPSAGTKLVEDPLQLVRECFR